VPRAKLRRINLKVKLTKEEYRKIAKMIRIGEKAGKRLRQFLAKIEITKLEDRRK